MVPLVACAVLACATTGTPTPATPTPVTTVPATPHACTGAPVDSSVFAGATIVTALDELHPERNVAPDRVPRYPRELRDAGIQGEVRASFTVRPDGQVDRESIVIDSETHPGFAKAVCDVLPRMRFVALLRNGQRVPSRVRSMPFGFSLSR